MEIENRKITIQKAARVLNISSKTLQRWDDKGRLKATNYVGVQKHRHYSTAVLRHFLINNVEYFGKKWAMSKRGAEPPPLFYCSNSATFQKRLNDLSNDIQEIHGFESIVAITGEIGNNSFDHNLGNWPDIVGIFFGWNVEKKIIVLADRGQGILKTLKGVRPTIQDSSEALFIAFTEIVTGRAPEGRGNGLKFVRRVIVSQPLKLHFQTGNAILNLRRNDQKIKIHKIPKSIIGCFAAITF